MLRALTIVIEVCSLAGETHELVEEDKEVTANVLGHLMRSFVLKVIRDVVLQVVDVLTYKNLVKPQFEFKIAPILNGRALTTRMSSRVISSIELRIAT